MMKALWLINSVSPTVRAMLQHQLDDVLRRLHAFGAPKVTLLSATFQTTQFIHLSFPCRAVHSDHRQLPAQVFILMILLLSWQSFFSMDASGEYKVVEYFAGVGRISRLAAGCGYKSCAVDIAYGDHAFWEGLPGTPTKKAEHLRMAMKLRHSKKNPMDITTSSGFV